MFTSTYFEYDNFVEKYFTLQKKEVCAQLFDPEKCFKIDSGIHNGKTRNEKRKKLLWFSFYINIANFEAFPKVKKLSTNLFFMKSDVVNKPVSEGDYMISI